MPYKTDFSKIDTSKYYFDAEAADSVVRYIEENCFHVKGALAGTPLILEDWQKKEIVRPLFGWKHIEPTIITDANGNVIKSINRRKYRKAYIELPKKQGKSTLLSGIAQVFLDIDPEQGSEIVGLAWGRKQAGIIFDMVEKSVRKNRRLSNNIQYYRSSKVLLSKDGQKRYSLWTKEAGGEDGQFPQLVLIDELHEHKNGEIVSVAEKSMMGRINPLSLTITTAGENLYGIGYERSQYCKKVAQGIIEDESQLVCIYCADAEDDIYDEKTWYKVLPQLGRSITIEDFREEVKAAKVSGAAENAFKRYFLNIWNKGGNYWIRDEDWMSSSWDFDTSQLQGKPCYGALDLGEVSDISSFTLIFPVDGKYISLNWFWLPEDKGTKSVDERNNRQYIDWLKHGFIDETSGNNTDYNVIQDKIEQLGKEYDIQEIAYDGWNANQMAVNLQENGFVVTKFVQSAKTFTEPMTLLFNMITKKGKKQFNHLNNPVLRWMASNVIEKKDTRSTSPTVAPMKEKMEDKIDGIVTNIMAFQLALDGVRSGSYMESGDISFI